MRFECPPNTLNTRNMDGLLPIIRRVRRPLLPVEGPAGGHQADAKPAAVPVTAKVEPAVDAQAERRKNDDGQVAPVKPAK